MPLPETEVLKQYNLIGDAIYYHHVRTEATGGEYLHPSEAHASYEMLLLLEGEISYIIEGETYTYSLANYLNGLTEEADKVAVQALYNYAYYAEEYVTALQNAENAQ